MQEQITLLGHRVAALESAQTTHMAQTTSIKSDTSELLETFQALKGAWAVLNFIGKLAKPVAALTTFLGTIYLLWGKK